MVFLQVIVGGLLLGAIYALFSSGLTLIWGMMNFINFAHGEFVMLGMYVAFLVVVWLHARRYSPSPRPLLCLCLALRFIFRLSAMSFAVRCLRRFSRPSDSHYCLAIRRSP